MLTVSRLNILGDAADAALFKTNQQLAVALDKDYGDRYYCIAFYLGVSDVESSIIVDNLQYLIKAQNNNERVRPTIGNTQHVQRKLKIYYQRAFVCGVNSRNIECSFQEFFA